MGGKLTCLQVKVRYKSTTQVQGEQRRPWDIAAALKQCSKTKDLEGGKKLHEEAVAGRHNTNKYVSSALITMYTKCRNMILARQVFDNMLQRDVVIWTALILGYVENGESSVAMELFSSMDCEPTHVSYLAVLKACTSLAVSDKQLYLLKGLALHEQLKERGFSSNILVASALVEMYSKCGSMHHARETFNGMPRKDVVIWTSLISGYVENGQCLEAMELFSNMDCEPNSFTYVAVLKACTGLGKKAGLHKGIVIHEQIKERVLDSNIVVANSLVDMYRKCGGMQNAREVFQRMGKKDVVTWNSLILGYVENGESSVALELFTSIDCECTRATYLAAIKACAALASERESERDICLEKGMGIHKQVTENRYDSDIAVANSLLDMYSKCGSMQRAKTVFDGMVLKNVITWTSLMMGYLEKGENSRALEVFASMDCEPNAVTYVAALKACGGLKEAEREFCLSIHEQVKNRGYDSDLVVANTLVDVYCKRGEMQRAMEVFNKMVYKNVVTWTCLILGYIENGEHHRALELFTSMDCEADSFAYVAALKACGGLEKPLEKITEIHKQLRDRGCDSDIFVGNTLVDVYCKCGSVHMARDVFEGMTRKDVVSWNALIQGYVEKRESSVALDLFVRMNCEPNFVTYVAILKACGGLSALPSGKWIHSEICRLGLEQERVVGNALVDLYGKCGCISAGEEFFNSMQTQDMVTWNALIAGYSLLGETSQVFSTVMKIHEGGLQMDGITFICILTACSHAGSVEEGKKCFESMAKYGVNPSLEHYNCMVDMLGRANRLEEAVSFVKSMPMKGDSVTWKSLLGSCRKWREYGVGKAAFDELVAEKTKDADTYALMREIYGSLSIGE